MFLFWFLYRIANSGGGVQTGSTRHRSHLLFYCACPGWLWRWRIIRWNVNWQGNPKYSEKTCPSAILSTTNPTWPDPGLNPGCRGGKPATNCLSYGAAVCIGYVGHSISNETNYYCSKTAELIHMKLSGHKVGNLAMTSDQLFNHIL
jgi:hypothetical protein